MKNAKLLKEYIEYHSRFFFSGFYEGRWLLLPSSRRPDFNKWNDPKKDQGLSNREKKDAMHRLGRFFENRDSTSGKV